MPVEGNIKKQIINLIDRSRSLKGGDPEFVSSDCFQRKFSDTITNFLKGLPGYAAFFTSGTTVEAS